MTPPTRTVECPCGATFETTSGFSRYCSFECNLWENVDLGEADECWPWTGYVAPNGYGMISQYRINGSPAPIRVSSAVAYTITGELPTTWMHTVCGLRSCANPKHIEAVPETPDECAFEGCAYPRTLRPNGQKHFSWCSAHDKHVLRYGKPRRVKWRNVSLGEAWARFHAARGSVGRSR